MNILAINISHNASVAFCKNGVITQYYEEDRFNRIKNWRPKKHALNVSPSSIINSQKKLNSIDEKLKIVNDTSLLCIPEKIKDNFDVVVYASYYRNKDKILGYWCDTNEDIISEIQKQTGNRDYFYHPDNHHIYHAVSGFYFSPFEEALAVVVDGGGAQPTMLGYEEHESIFYIDKKNVELKFQHQSNYKFTIKINPIDYNPIRIPYQAVSKKFNGTDYVYSSKMSGGTIFRNFCCSIGLDDANSDGDSSGKLMGLSAYDINTKRLEPEKIKAAKLAQEELYENTIKLIDRALTYSDTKNIILSGGCALNCLNNFRYVKKYPNLNFFVDPVAHDGGTAIGAALYYNNYWHG